NLFLLSGGVAWAEVAQPAVLSRPGEKTPLIDFINLPLSFEANEGQIEAPVKFLSRGPGYTLFLTPTQAVMSLQGGFAENSSKKQGRPHQLHAASAARREASRVLLMNLLGANPEPQMETLEPLPGRANYFLGPQPEAWRTGIRHYGKIRCREVYAGIDLVYYGFQGQLEFDFIVQPGAAPGSIRLRFEGADRLELDAEGGLVAYLGGCSVRWPKPSFYQFVAGAKKGLAGDYVLLGREEVAFRVSAYDLNSPLVIDPVLVYSSYLGGSARDAAEAIAVDRLGNVYITGQTLSLTFPTSVAYRSTTAGSNDVFVTK